MRCLVFQRNTLYRKLFTIIKNSDNIYFILFNKIIYGVFIGNKHSNIIIIIDHQYFKSFWKYL